MSKRIDDCEEALSIAEQRITQLESENRLLRVSLALYGSHKHNCPAPFRIGPCNCGYTEALNPQEVLNG